MTFTYPRRLVLLVFALAALFQALPLIAPGGLGTMQPAAWVLLEGFILAIAAYGVKIQRYALMLEDDALVMRGVFTRSRHALAEITEIRVWIARGTRMAVVKFADDSSLSFPAYLKGFSHLVQLLRSKTGLAAPAWEE